MQSLNEFHNLIKVSYKIWSEKNPYLIGGSIAFYIIFSIAPLFVMVIMITGFVFGRQAAEGQIVEEIENIVGFEAAQIVQEIINKASTPPTRMITTIISVPMVILGSSMVFFQIRHALNLLWDLENQKANSAKEFFKDYFFSFMMVLIAGGVVFLLVLKTPLLYLLRDYLNDFLPVTGIYIRIIDALITFCIMVLLLGFLYKILPKTDIEWRDVWVGSFVTSLLFTAAVILINLYVTSTGVDSAYGAIGAGTILLIWIYYSSLVFLFGAAFTKAYASNYGAERTWKEEVSK